MSERERWIIYPLLFLALGAALRDKLAKQTRTKQLVCEQLFVVDAEGRPMAELRGSNLRLDFGGPQQGYVIANVVHAKSALYQRGQLVTPQPAGNGMGVSWPQLLQLLQKMGLLQVEPTVSPDATPNTGPKAGQNRPSAAEALPGGAAQQESRTEAELSAYL